MLIGLISDTHNNIAGIESAIHIFKTHNLGYIIHLGDYTSAYVVDYFKDFRLLGVLGNNDHEVDLFYEAFEKIGGDLGGEFYEYNEGNVRVALYHGTKASFKEELIRSGKYDIVLYGHTHRAEIKRVGSTLCVNPGALKRVTRPSVAILDTVELNASIIYL